MKKILLLIALLAGFGLVLGGCSSSTEPAEADTANLEDFGQFEATDEAPDFGDPNLTELLADSEEEEYDDPVALSPIVVDVENQDRPDIFSFRMIWGNLPRDTGVTQLLDWSGKLTVSRGAIVVTHLIRFERGQDYLLPRYNDEGFYVPEELRWVSKTSCCIDGIATRLYIPPSATDEVVTVTYTTRRMSITFTMDQLEDLDSLVNVGHGHAVSFQAMRHDPGTNRPLHGHLRGVWGRDDSGQGIFYGRWMSSGGRLMGALKGVWGVDSTGNQVFIGKWIDRSGRFRGFVKGVWGERTDVNSFGIWGEFRGRIFNADRRPIGILGGHYASDCTSPNFYFVGRWCVGGGCTGYSTDRP